MFWRDSSPAPMTLPTIPAFEHTLAQHALPLTRSRPRVLQINLGKLCNLTCVHCHVNAGPHRTEIMHSDCVDHILDWLANSSIESLDLTGGTPEMIPDFRRLVIAARRMGKRVMNRCNLTILNEPGYEWVADFHREQQVHLIASMPCYSPDNVNAQRGEGVFDSSIQALQTLNALGYGQHADLPLDLVYNPVGASLPPNQAELEADYKRELQKHFGLVFNQLFVITNMPIARFASYLKRQGHYQAYQQLLLENFNPASIEGLMCRDTISVDWEGRVYDCDFNQQLGLQQKVQGQPLYVWQLEEDRWQQRPILLGQHCYGCTAGQGSSCGGATT